MLALGYPDRNILLLTGEQATRSAIQKYVEIWLPKNVKADSQVLFYFSGHGAPDPASKQAYLVPWDGDPKFLENTGYPVAKLYKSLGALKARKVLVALDSCFSGAGGRSVLAQGTRPLVMKIDSSIPAGAENISILSASAGDQISGSDNAQGHGLFTYYLLRSLNRSGGKTSVKDAYASLVPDVEDAARRQNRAQTPQLASGSGAVFFR
ncbi:MAG: caspase family protein [Elusimicrobia bacterium]|nr:caspase family protein [Elusimicrobiota bacterium]